MIGTTVRGGWLIEDPDYTFLAMTRFAEGVKLFWGKVFGQVYCPLRFANDARAKK
jgi:hypothetical protein